MESGAEKVRLEMRNLIVTSCQFDKLPTKQFRRFHKDLLNFFFNSIDSNIDYEKKMIFVWNSKPLTTNPVRLFDLNEAVADTVGYTDLEETLSGCLESGHLQDNFYIKLLSEYGGYSNDDGDILSA